MNTTQRMRKKESISADIVYTLEKDKN